MHDGVVRAGMIVDVGPAEEEVVEITITPKSLSGREGIDPAVTGVGRGEQRTRLFVLLRQHH
jgi:hypothetical protein